MSLPRFGVRRPVPANILMMVLILGGIGAGLNMTREFFPDTTPESATISLPVVTMELEEEYPTSVEALVEDRVTDRIIWVVLEVFARRWRVQEKLPSKSGWWS